MNTAAAPPFALLARRRWWLGMALALGIGLFQALPDFFAGESLASIAMSSLLWVLETPLQVVLLSVVFAYGVEKRLGTTSLVVVCLLVALALGGLFGLGFVLLFEGTMGLSLDQMGPLSPAGAAGFGAITGLLIAGIWGLAFVSPHLTEQARRRQQETERLRMEAEQLRVSSELASLRSQLEPHFLLNTLNTIAGFASQDPREARRLLGCLGDLLRDSLQSRDEMQPLEREVTWLKRYADILESRHGDLLHFQWDIAPNTGGMLIPRLLLQPLLENAVQHGALCRAGGGRVTVKVELRAAEPGGPSKLVCTVTDNGPGLAAAAPRDGAIGLHTVRRRLELRCPGSDLRLESSSEGTAAVVEVPIMRGVAA